jgi:transposase
LVLEATIEAIGIERPRLTARRPRYLCLDAASDNEPSRETATRHGSTAHIRPARKDGGPARKHRRAKPRRWVAERTLAWLSKCRVLLVRHDKHWENYLGLVHSEV